MRHPIVDLDGKRSDSVSTVGHSRRRHRVGDQRHPLRADAADDVAQQGRVQVNAVGDQFHRYHRIFQKRDHRTRFAMMNRPHRVEQMRRHRCACGDRRAGLLVARVGVTHGGNRSRSDDPADRLECPGPLRGQGDHPYRSLGGGEQPVDLGWIRVAQEIRIVRATALHRQPRPLQMDSGDQPRAHGLDKVGYLPQ